MSWLVENVQSVRSGEGILQIVPGDKKWAKYVLDVTFSGNKLTCTLAGYAITYTLTPEQALELADGLAKLIPKLPIEEIVECQPLK